jgi:2-dehydro-3-deoxy-D-arabinonate dehydratase
MKLYRTHDGIFFEQEDRWYVLSDADPKTWDRVLNHRNLLEGLRSSARKLPRRPAPPSDFVAPIGSQEIWAAGVTYLRSRDARMDESNRAGASNFYDKVYDADRPELFFKSPASRAIGPEGTVRLRSDSKWQVPEPELVLVINARNEIIGYTIGNDMSCRDIEGENPLYLPQAKIYNGSCALGPCILVSSEPPSPDTGIAIEINRNAACVFAGSTTLAQMKRTFEDLRDHLTRHLTFPVGAYLFTGTGVVPPDSLSLEIGDTITIRIDGIGQLTNTVGGPQ